MDATNGRKRDAISRLIPALVLVLRRILHGAVLFSASLIYFSNLLQAQLVATQNVLTVTTPNLTAVFTGSDLTGLKNSLTGESYLNPHFQSQLLDLMELNPTGQLTVSNWQTGTDAMQQPVATLKFQDGVRSGIFQVAVDPSTHELVIHLSGQSTAAGIKGLGWGIAGIDLSSGARIVLPTNGGNYIDLKHLSRAQFQYPTNWAAQMVLVEGSDGGFLAYSTDSTFQFKDVYVNAAGSSAANLQLSTEAVAPWPTATSVSNIEWRVQVFSGDWRFGASLYKNWSRAKWPVNSPNSATSWARDIQVGVSMDATPEDTNVLDQLASLLDPHKTLLHLSNWRPYGMNVGEPDYTPLPSLRAFIEHAHSLGFHVQLYVDATGVSTSGPAYTSQIQDIIAKYQMKTPDTLTPTGWEWDSPPSTPTRLANINPAASAWRRILLDAIEPVIAADRPDSIHLDAVELAITNDGNGIIEGMNSPQGIVQLHKDALARFPGVVFGTEGLSETSLPYCGVAQRWEVTFALPSHPITTFLQGDQVRFYGHISNPDPNLPGFLSWERSYETQGVLPLLHGQVTWTPDAPAIARIFRQVSEWQKHSYQPDWSANWSSALFNYIGSDGSTAMLSDDGTLLTLADASGTIYQRVHDSNQIRTRRFIDGWQAFDDENLYGLDPANEYWLDAIPRPLNAAHIGALPAGIKLGVDTKITGAAANVSLVSVPPPSFDFFAEYPFAELGFSNNGLPTPSQLPAFFSVSETVVGGVARRAIFEHPPDPGYQSFIEYVVPVPNATNVVLGVSVGIADLSPRTDPVTFSVEIDGNTKWKLATSRGSWQNGTIDLTAWAGSTVHVRLVTECGPTGNAYAWAFWSNLNLSWNVVAQTADLTLVLPAGVSATAFSGGGRLQNVAGSASIQGVPVPGGFIAFLGTAPATSEGQSLVGLPFNQYTAEPGGLPTGTNPVYGTPSIGVAASGGVSQSDVLITHPSNFGRSVTGWTLQLPTGNPVQLSFSVGLLDGLPIWGSGITFSVLVNGTVMWSAPGVTSFGWLSGSVDLSTFKGQTVLVEAVSDTGMTGVYVAALWSGMTLDALPGASLAGPPRISSVNNAASYQSSAVSPGEIVTLFGSNMGPSQLVSATLSSANQFPTSISGVSALFDGIQAPLMYVSSNQIGAVVPLEIVGAATRVEVVYNGSTSIPVAVPVVASTPGIFSADGSGGGQAAALNADYSVNSPSSPIAGGQVVLLFGTGAGFMDPNCADGTLASTLAKPLQNLGVTIGGVNAEVRYGGSSPGQICGVLQINAVVPAALSSGPQPVVLTVGPGTNSQIITISVK